MGPQQPNEPPQPRNLFEDSAPPTSGERFDELCRTAQFRVERIVSSLRPDDAPYDQAHDEWVVLLRGCACLEIDGAPHELAEGDSLLLPARTPHRVLRTSEGALWLAVHATSEGA